MSLIRQVWLLLLMTLLLAFAGALGLSALSARHYLETQLSLKNQDSARSLALALALQRGEPATAQALLKQQFDVGFLQQLRWRGVHGQALLDLTAAPAVDDAPPWFEAALAIRPVTGVAAIHQGDKVVGSLEVQSQTRFAVRELWRSFRRMSLALTALGLVIAGMAYLLLRRLRQPLMATVQQAQALTERRFVTVAEPNVPELRNVTRAMNAMVERLRAMFDEQAGQVDLLRRQAHCDELTGVSNRPHFLGRLKSLLNDEDGGSGGALVLVRICDLQGINRRLGRVQTDALLRDTGAALLEAGAHAGSRFEAGRLNGSDFAVILPESGSLREPAGELAARLRDLLRLHHADANAVVGAVRWWHGAPASSLLAAADHALARAEARGAFAVELYDTGDQLAMGEDAWRGRLEVALAGRQVQLVEFPVMDVNRAVLHLECPLRLRIDGLAELVPAAQWLPMARRAQLTARIDLVAVELALQAMAEDGMARAVNLCPGSLRDSTLMPQLRALLTTYEAQAPGLWLEVSEAGALRELKLLRELVNMAHARGAKVGLEHAGEHLSDAAVLLEAGLDFVKLDASFTEGLAQDNARAQHVATTVRLLHGIGIKAYAEGVTNRDDAEVLWHAGVEGITGPVTADLVVT